MLDLFEEFRALMAALDEAGVECAVCGGLAVAIHARPRATLDVDLLVPDEHLDGAKRVGRGLGHPVDGAMPRARLGEKPDSVEFINLHLHRVTSAIDEVWAHRERVVWEHGSLPTVSRRGLIALKRLRGSGQDRDDIPILEAETDMSSRAVTLRLRRTAQLRRLCLSLRRSTRPREIERAP